MYGTVARLRVNPGAESALREQLRAFDALHVPGALSSLIYRMDADANEYFMAVVFDSKEAYTANANSPEQAARYQELRALLASDPEWHDGEIVYQSR